MKTKDDVIVISQRANGWIIQTVNPETDEPNEFVAETVDSVAKIVKAALNIY